MFALAGVQTHNLWFMPLKHFRPLRHERLPVCKCVLFRCVLFYRIESSLCEPPPVKPMLVVSIERWSNDWGKLYWWERWSIDVVEKTCVAHLPRIKPTMTKLWTPKLNQWTKDESKEKDNQCWRISDTDVTNILYKSLLSLSLSLSPKLHGKWLTLTNTRWMLHCLSIYRVNVAVFT